MVGLFAMAVASPARAEKPEKRHGKRVVFSVTVGGRTVSMILQAVEYGMVVWDGSVQPPPVDAPESPEDVAQSSPHENEISAEEKSEESAAPPVDPTLQTDSPSDASLPTPPSDAKIELSEPPASTPSTEIEAPAQVPDWIDKNLRSSQPFQKEGDFYLIAIDGQPAATIEESRQDMDERILDVAQNFVYKEFLKDFGPMAPVHDRLTIDWIKKNWLVPGKEYDKLMKVNDEEYHQFWVQLKIPESDRRVVEEWRSESTRQERVKQLAGSTVVGVGSIALFHLMVGIIARRKRKTT